MKYRKLRIAWSATCGIICLLLIVLWVRSYHYADGGPLGSLWGRFFTIGSSAGEFTLMERKLTPAMSAGRWEFSSLPQIEGKTKLHPDLLEPQWAMSIGFRWKFVPTAGVIVMPLWFPIGLIATFGAVPWLPRRFSLRTLLIAMTLVAVVLGWVVYVARK